MRRGNAKKKAKPKSSFPGSKAGKWAEESASLRANLRNARGAKPKVENYNGVKIDGNAANSAMPSNFTECKHCGRSFNDKAAERHIPYCAEK